MIDFSQRASRSDFYQDAAQSALALHGREVGEGLNMNVLISDPSRKKERTDSNADAKEVYIAGLSKLAKEDDVQAVFSEARSPTQESLLSHLKSFTVWRN